MIKSRFKKLDGHMQEVLKKGSAALLIAVLGSVFGFAVSFSLAHLLGAGGVGIYFLAFSVATIVATIGRLGFDNTVVRFVASSTSTGNWKDVLFVHDYAIRVAWIATSILAVMLFFSAEWLAGTVFNKPLMAYPLMLVAVAVVPLAISMIQAESLRGMKCIPASQWIKMVIVSVVTLILLYPFVQAWGVNGAVASFMAASLVSMVLAYFLWKKAYQQKVLSKDIENKKTLSSSTLFQSSWPLFTVAITGLVMQQAATIFLGVWGSVEDIGVFNIANRIAALLLFPLMAMISILTPKFSEIYRQGDMGGMQKLARRSSHLLTILAVPVAIFVALYSEGILTLFGNDFAKGAMVLMILLAGVIVNAATGAVGSVLMMSGHEKSVRSATVIAAFLTIGMLFIFVPTWKDIGAAIAVTVGISIQNLLMVWYVYKRLGFMPCALGKI